MAYSALSPLQWVSSNNAYSRIQDLDTVRDEEGSLTGEGAMGICHRLGLPLWSANSDHNGPMWPGRVDI